MKKQLQYLSRAIWQVAKPHHRTGDYWHTAKHIESMFSILWSNFENFYAEFPQENWLALIFAICYHDSVYFPGRSDNEELSYVKFTRDFGENEDVKRMILGTRENSDEFDPILHDLDYGYFSDAALFAVAEQGIRNEYVTGMQIPGATYENGRREFLRSILSKPIFVTKTMLPYNGIAQALISAQLDGRESSFRKVES